MSRSYLTNTQIPRGFFPAIGKTALLKGKPVVARNFQGETDPDAQSFCLQDQDENTMALYFQGGVLTMFDFHFGAEAAEWMRTAILAAWRKKLPKLPKGPRKMPKRKRPAPKGTWALIEKLNGPSVKRETSQTILLPTAGLDEVSSRAFRKALELHGLKVVSMPKKRALEVTNPHGEILVGQRSPGVIPIYSQTEDDGVDVMDARELPYILTEHDYDFIELMWFRAPLPGENIGKNRMAFRLMESTGIGDEGSAVREMRAEDAEKKRIANLDAENAALKAKLAAPLWLAYLIDGGSHGLGSLTQILLTHDRAEAVKAAED